MKKLLKKLAAPCQINISAQHNKGSDYAENATTFLSSPLKRLLRDRCNTDRYADFNKFLAKTCMGMDIWGKKIMEGQQLVELPYCLSPMEQSRCSLWMGRIEEKCKPH